MGFNLAFKGLRKKLAKCYIWTPALYGAENWTSRKVDQKYLGSSGTWCWRSTDKISWTDCVRDEELFYGFKEYPT